MRSISPEVFYFLASASRELGDLDYALQRYFDSLDLDSSNPLTHSGLSSCYIEMDNYVLARIHASKAIELKRDFPDPYIQISIIERNTNDLNSAASSLEKETGFGQAAL